MKENYEYCEVIQQLKIEEVYIQFLEFLEKCKQVRKNCKKLGKFILTIPCLLQIIISF